MTFDQTRYQIFITGQMVNLLMEKKKFTEQDALEAFLNSETYQMVADPECKMWD